jgi:hypothetical protein
MHVEAELTTINVERFLRAEMNEFDLMNVMTGDSQRSIAVIREKNGRKRREGREERRREEKICKLKPSVSRITSTTSTPLSCILRQRKAGPTTELRSGFLDKTFCI